LAIKRLPFQPTCGQIVGAAKRWAKQYGTKNEKKYFGVEETPKEEQKSLEEKLFVKRELDIGK